MLPAYVILPPGSERCKRARMRGARPVALRRRPLRAALAHWLGALVNGAVAGASALRVGSGDNPGAGVPSGVAVAGSAVGVAVAGGVVAVARAEGEATAGGSASAR